ncbi:MAG: formylglycine-generating enzyme family protein [Paramuribaculum sp.]|nr:formylglycine-generating enzyme family protein [Paramuribaculum sp.]
MKYLTTLLSLLLTCIVTLCLSSCGDGDSSTSGGIQDTDFVGSWQSLDTDGGYLVLKANGTGYLIETFDDDTEEQSLRWYYDNQYLYFILSGGNEKMFVNKITGSLMILTDSEEYTYTYARIRESEIPDHESSGDDEDDDDNTGNNPQNTAITTLSADPHAFRATLSGRYTGGKLPETVGFEYSYDSKFPSKQTATVTVEGKFGGFDIEATGMVDQIKIYYRAFAVINGETIYGQTKSFTTPQATYTIDGKSYNFIKVTGLATGSFSMMQTELPPTAELEIDGIAFGCLNINNDNKVTKGEMREFLSKLSSECVFFRYPTPEEWLYAASGGTLCKDYKYSGSNDIDEVAWYAENSNNHARKPAPKIPNELGLYDMSGNYAELSVKFDSDHLEDIREKLIKKFVNRPIDISAEYFNTMWAATGGAFGGNWSSLASKCQATSLETTPVAYNYFDGNKYTVRFVYSRPD